MYWLQLVVIVALLAAVGWLAIGGGGHMSEPQPDRPDLALPREGLLGRTDVDRVRFSVGARGYRMDEVDDVLDRLAQEIELREDRIADLEGRPRRARQDGADASAEVSPGSESEAAQAQDEEHVVAEPGASEQSAAEHNAVEQSANEQTGENGDNAV